MTSEKKLIIKRLVVYIALSFIPPMVAVLIINDAMGGLIFDGELAASPVTALVGFLGMMCPAIASIITRLITKEGFKNTFLRANFKGNMKYYALAAIIPVVFSLVGALIARLVYGAAENNEFSTLGGIAFVIMQTGTGITMAFYGFGEELGWRGYMMPKLEKLIGMPASIVVGGVIWGLWHAPLTCSGHNFGTDYKGFPFVGIGLMCVMCVLMGSILTFVTKRTKSIYPASILHMVNNSVFGVATGLLVSSKADAVGTFLLVFIPMGIIAAVTFALMLKESVGVSAKPKVANKNIRV